MKASPKSSDTFVVPYLVRGRSFHGEAGRKIYSGSCFPNPAFLICHRDDSCQISPNSRCGENLEKSKLRCKLFHVEQKNSCTNFVTIELHIVSHGTQDTSNTR